MCDRLVPRIKKLIEDEKTFEDVEASNERYEEAIKAKNERRRLEFELEKVNRYLEEAQQPPPLYAEDDANLPSGCWDKFLAGCCGLQRIMPQKPSRGNVYINQTMNSTSEDLNS